VIAARPGFLVLACALSALAVSARAPAASDRILEAATVTEDFSGDGLGQFASYPPAQDIGYEPSLTPTRGHGAPGGRALMRVVTPTARGPLAIGVIRRLALAVASGTSVSFSYRLEIPGAAAVIEAGLAGADGVRYTGRQDGAAGEWRTLTLTREHLRADGGGPAAQAGELQEVVAGGVFQDR